MTPQSTFMISATVQDEQLEPLRKLLAGMNMEGREGHADPDNELVPFSRFSNLHFARFTIVEARTAEEIRAFGVTPRPWKPTLVFLGDIDGDRAHFFAELEKQAGPGLTRVFSHCENFPTVNANLQQWLSGNNIEPSASYVNWIGRTVRQIHEEVALHDCLAGRLARVADEIGRDKTRALRRDLLDFVQLEQHAGRLTLTPPEPTPLRWNIDNCLHLLGVPLILLLLSPLFILIAPFFVWRLRTLERSDPELFIRPDAEYINQLAAQEDHLVSNQYNVFGDVKPGLFRLYTFKFLLLLTDYTARHVFNRGFLGRIKTIHFARWVFMDDNHRAFFASNYDGSHESYMDDFINKVSWGLNITFSCAVGYPTTEWLIKQGAQRELPFKYTQRRHQLPTEVWYKAYPELTAVELARNSRIRQGVEIRQSSDDAIREWLGLI